jgi:predicted lipoprotein with Yx(FWY)xxD motif
MFLKRSLMIAFSVFIALFIVACGNATTTGGGSYGSGSSTPPANTPNTGGTSTSVIQTATVTIKGQSQTVLTNSKGLTLYYFTPDTATQSACSGQCAHNWPPLFFSGSGAPTSSANLSGKLSVLMDVNGSQVEYNGHLLYAFAGDTAPGQTNGQGLFGKWLVATPDLSVLADGSTAVIQTATVTINGKSQTVLTNAQGMTLYYFTPDSATQTACTGQCAQNWPPLFFTGSGSPTSSTNLTGKLSVLADVNGSQVEYNGHLLYAFAGDKAAGQTNGQGLFSKWFVATPDLSA